MTVKEAYVLITNYVPNMKVLSCHEYETLFVFQMVPEDYTDTKPLLSGAFSVDKKTGNIGDFKPFHIPISEYRHGKKVTDYK